MEALNVSVNEFGAVNIPYMLSIYEPDITAMKEEVATKEGTTAENIGFSEDLEMDLKRAAFSAGAGGTYLSESCQLQ